MKHDTNNVIFKENMFWYRNGILLYNNNYYQYDMIWYNDL